LSFPKNPLQQGLLAERVRLQEEVGRLKEQSQADAARTAAALEQRGEVLAKQAADLGALREALARSDAELRAAQLELQLRSRQAAHEEVGGRKLWAHLSRVGLGGVFWAFGQHMSAWPAGTSLQEMVVCGKRVPRLSLNLRIAGYYA
jgi:chorismate mutase